MAPAHCQEPQKGPGVVSALLCPHAAVTLSSGCGPCFSQSPQVQARSADCHVKGQTLGRDQA